MKSDRAKRFITLLDECEKEPALIAEARVAGFLAVWLNADEEQAEEMREALIRWVSAAAQKAGGK